ncbi:MAG: BMP family ABC transporter substrate-binding protein [Spirochaetia bacterium]|nr:BMP family ABC transporter substrate-binding protein [Spirochaetia bacterium]
MKYRVLLLALLVPALVMFGCQKSEPAPVAKAFTVGLVTDVGGIDDKSFNQGTWEGVVKFAADNGLVKDKDVKYLQSAAEQDYVPNLSTFADEKLDIIIAPGFLFVQAMGEVAAKYPEQKFLLIDDLVKDANGNFVPNVANATFAEHEGSFLVGVAAGLKAKADGKNTLGFIGGMKFALIEKFQAGFEQGVKAVFPEAKILVDYADSFTDAAKGQALAQKQFNAGAYIIFHAAGATGNGMIKEAKERQEKGQVVWGIGVDKDQYADGVFGTAGKSAVLTSMMKRVDVAAYDVAKMAKDGNFPGGQQLVFNLKNKGVGIPNENPNLSADIVAKVNEYAAKIGSGELVVSEIPAQ